jgi:predicted nucleotidyltransferase
MSQKMKNSKTTNPTPIQQNNGQYFDVLAGGTALTAVPSVVCAWLFGSSKIGVVQPGSDIDVGVLFSQMPDLAELLLVVGILEDSFGGGQVDLVTLNDAAPVLRFEAISGRRIFCRDEAQFAAFFSLTAREYEEAMAYLTRGLRYRREAMAHQPAKH